MKNIRVIKVHAANIGMHNRKSFQQNHAIFCHLESLRSSDTVVLAPSSLKMKKCRSVHCQAARFGIVPETVTPENLEAWVRPAFRARARTSRRRAARRATVCAHALHARLPPPCAARPRLAGTAARARAAARRGGAAARWCARRFAARCFAAASRRIRRSLRVAIAG